MFGFELEEMFLPRAERLEEDDTAAGVDLEALLQASDDEVPRGEPSIAVVV